MREVWLAVLQLAVQLALGERALAFSRKTSDWPNASVLYVLNDAPADLGTKGETTAADKTSPTSFAKVASDRSNEAVFEHTTVHPTRVFPELPTDEFSLAPAFDFPTIPRASAEAPLRSASEDTRNAVPRKEGAAVKLDPVLLGSRQDAPSFVEGSPETIRFEKGALTPAVCRQAHCGRGGSLPFFDKSKKSCFSVTSCRDCPDHSGGLETICQLHGRRKGFTTLIQNTLVPGAPSQLFKYRRATKEEIESSIVRQTPLHRVRGVAGAEGESSAGARLAAGAEDGTEEEFGEEGGQSLGEEEEYEFIQMTQSALGADEAVPSPCELSANSDASPAPSFLTVSAMPGFDSYEQDEMETLGEAEDATSQPAADASAPGRTSRSGESASFSLPASALLSPPKDCLVDHKGYTRLHLSVILASKDFRKEGAAVRDAYGPSSAFSSEGAGGSPGEGAFSAGDEGFGEDFDEFGNAGDTGGFVELGTAAPPASSFAQVADFADDDPKPGLMSKLGGLFKRNKDEEADEGGADEDDSQGKKPGIFKRLFRRKSRASEEEELGEDYEGEELPPTRSRRTKRKGHKGALSRARSAGRALKRGVAAPVKALKGPGFPARLKVQIVTAVSSPAASACSRPATWTGVLKESNLLKFAFEIRVRNVEVEAAFVDFVRSSLSVHLTCRQKSCRLEDSLLACAQVSCPKKRRQKAGVRERWEEHDTAVQQQLQQIATVLQHADTPEQLSMQDRIKIAKAYSEKMRQDQIQTQKIQDAQQRVLKEHLHEAQEAMKAQEKRLLQQEAQRQLMQRETESPEEDLISEEAGRETIEKRRSLPGVTSSGTFSTAPHAIFSRINWRVGGRGQVRTNKGFKPQQLQSLGNALYFARWSKHLRAATVGEFVKNNVSPATAAEIKNPGVYIRRIESGEILPSLECRKQLEKVLGVHIAPERRRKRPKL